MNILEKKILSVLQRGKEHYSFLGIKAEFEAEGTRMDEMIQLSQIVRRAGLNLGIKIGGCEAISDLYNTKLLGAEYIIAPMIETPYALSKYIEAKNKAYLPEEQGDVRFLFNLETITAFNNLDEMIKVASKANAADGIVFGRVDFTSSMELSRSDIAGDKIQKYLDRASDLCKENNLDFVVGGGVAKETMDPINKVQKNYLSRFETRKIIFDAEMLENKNIDINKALEQAVHFELLWLQYKQQYYTAILKEDEGRIKMLEERFKNISN